MSCEKAGLLIACSLPRSLGFIFLFPPALKAISFSPVEPACPAYNGGTEQSKESDAAWRSRPSVLMSAGVSVYRLVAVVAACRSLGAK